MTTIREIPYRDLRNAIETVQAFVEPRVGRRFNRLRVGLEDDLRIAGLDTDSLFEEFVKKFNVSHEHFLWDDFEWIPESPLFLVSISWREAMLAPLKAILGLAYGIGKVISLIFGENRMAKFPYLSFFEGENPPPHKRAVFTGGDLVRSFLEGRISARKDVLYKFPASENYAVFPQI